MESEFHSCSAFAYFGAADSRSRRRREAVVRTIFPLLDAITSLGDPGFVLAASGGLVAALLAVGDRRTAAALGLAVATSAAVTVAAKIGFMTSGIAELHSPSGHAASATTVFLCFGAIAAARRSAWAGAVLCATCALAVAASRVMLGFHSPGEAVIGVAIGLCAFAVFRRLAAPRPVIGRGPVVACFATAFCLHAVVGQGFSFEAPLEHIAAALGRLTR
jgi:membrane-associated phospholipid phosphatase